MTYDESYCKNRCHAQPVCLCSGGKCRLQLCRRTHSYSNCDGGAKNKILARFQNEDGTVSNYSICSEGREVNGVAALEEVDYAFSNFSGTTVYEGTLDNGEKVMTVTCSSQYVANIDINKEAVEGYDLYVVNNDGTETKLEVGIGARRASFKVDMSQGAVLIHMVAQN